MQRVDDPRYSLSYSMSPDTHARVRDGARDRNTSNGRFAEELLELGFKALKAQEEANPKTTMGE